MWLGTPGLTWPLPLCPLSAPLHSGKMIEGHGSNVVRTLLELSEAFWWHYFNKHGFAKRPLKMARVNWRHPANSKSLLENRLPYWKSVTSNGSSSPSWQETHIGEGWNGDILFGLGHDLQHSHYHIDLQDLVHQMDRSKMQIMKGLTLGCSMALIQMEAGSLPSEGLSSKVCGREGYK